MLSYESEDKGDHVKQMLTKWFRLKCQMTTTQSINDYQGSATQTVD